MYKKITLNILFLITTSLIADLGLQIGFFKPDHSFFDRGVTIEGYNTFTAGDINLFGTLGIYAVGYETKADDGLKYNESTHSFKFGFGFIHNLHISEKYNINLLAEAAFFRHPLMGFGADSYTMPGVELCLQYEYKNFLYSKNSFITGLTLNYTLDPNGDIEDEKIRFIDSQLYLKLNVGFLFQSK